MKNMLISLAIGAGAIFASSANAAPITTGIAMLPNDNIENVRLVCDQFGRCYRTRGGRYGYGYAPGYYGGYAPGYYGGYAPGYYGGYAPGYYGGYGPGVGIGIGPFGVGVGVGPRW
jgi:hypothetical protein